MKTIFLMFDKSIIALAGEQYGRKVFNKQVRHNLGGADLYYHIVIPKNIKMMSSSFIQGFFHYWINTIGVEGVRSRVSIETPHKDLECSIFQNLT